MRRLWWRVRRLFWRSVWGRSQPPVLISGLWVRRIGDHIEVLIERRPGDWRLIAAEWVPENFGYPSDIFEPGYLRHARPDPINAALPPQSTLGGGR